MDYHIYCNGSLIASFVDECDRDVCLDTLHVGYPDDEFTTECAFQED